MSFLRYAAIAAAFLFVACVPALADVTGLVRGTVLIDGKPAPAVTVTLHGEGATVVTHSGKQGDYSFPRVLFGHYSVTAHKDGYTDAVAQVDVASDSVATVGLTLGTLHQIARTTATVRGAAGTPVSQNALGRQQISVLPSNGSLNSIVQTVPGIVKFSYNEPVAHGFHGLTYEIDGAPLPQSSSANFSEIIDPKEIDSVEVFTGAFPAEFGGQRQGAVVNLVSHRPTDLQMPEEGLLSLGGGSYGTAQTALSESLKFGSTRTFLNVDDESSTRGLDSPTVDPQHDGTSQANQFLRVLSPAGSRGTLAFDLSNQVAIFQIPNNYAFSEITPVVNAPGTDDVQREYDRFANLSFTQTSKDGNGFLQVIPWVRYSRIAYDGDVASDLQGYFLDTSQSPPVKTSLDSLRQDRISTYEGLRLSDFHASTHHAIKAGVDTSIENFSSNDAIYQLDASQPSNINVFPDVVSKRGTQLGAYIEDKWSPSRVLTVNAGVRYDYSNGFVEGNQISPRVEVNLAPDGKNVVHFYYGRLYAAPFLEDTRRDAVVTGNAPDANPVYDLKPEHDTYTEMGIAHTFSPEITGYINYFRKNAANVLDTTQIFPTPIFAVFNNLVGRDEGVEVRLQKATLGGDSFFLSGTVQQSLAGGISGSTFLFPPSALSDATLQPEDHDQTLTLTGAYTHRFGEGKAYFATLAPQYGTGYPVEFESGPDRLPPHLTFDALAGRDPGRFGRRSLGFTIGAENVFNKPYLIKVNNGFNTTQWAPGAKVTLRLSAPL